MLVAMRKRLWHLYPAWPMVAAAFALRAAAIIVLHSYRFPPTNDHYLFGTEMGRIGRALASGHGFASPLQGNTGPTAMVGPVYPLLIAGVFKLTGIYTPISAIILLTLSALFSSLTALVIYETGREAFGEKTGVWGGWAWVISPFAIFWPIRWVWDTGLSALLFALVFLVTLRLARSLRVFDGAWYGLLWGVVVLTNTTFLPLLPAFLAWIGWRHHRRGGRPTGPVAAAAAVFVLTLIPWLVRNDLAFGRLLLRSNMGLELALGNLPGTQDPRAWQRLHPAFSPPEMARYRALGELRYMAEKQREAVAYIVGHPAQFARTTVAHALYFWFGVNSPDRMAQYPEVLYGLLTVFALAGLTMAIVRHRPAAVPLIATMVLFPLVYYITHPDLRFRHLIEPELTALAAYAVTILFYRRHARVTRQPGRVPAPELASETPARRRHRPDGAQAHLRGALPGKIISSRP